ncbi:MAG: ABC transporter permease [Bacteroidia bacterium]
MDENYLVTARYTVEEGRAISVDDVEAARKVVVLGHAISEKLFPHGSPIGKKVSVNGEFFTVVGAFQEMGTAGSTLGGDLKSRCPSYHPLGEAIRPNRNFTISVFVSDIGRWMRLWRGEAVSGLVRNLDRRMKTILTLKTMPSLNDCR